MDSKRFRIACPDCAAELVVDAATGEVLHHTPAKSEPAGGKTFDSLLQALDDDKSRAEEIFEREKAAFKDRDRLLEERFEEALKQAGDLDDDTPPPSPFDAD